MARVQRYLPWIVALILLNYLTGKSVGSGAISSADSIWLTVFVTMFVAILLEAVPFVLLGAVISGALEVLAPSETLAAWIPRNRILAVLLSGLAGFVLPICECGVVPVLRRLLRKGVPLSCGVTYLLAAPIVQPLVAASTFVAFGRSWKMVGLRMLGGYIIAVTVGLLSLVVLEPLGRERVLIDSGDGDSCGHSHGHDPYHGHDHGAHHPEGDAGHDHVRSAAEEAAEDRIDASYRPSHGKLLTAVPVAERRVLVLPSGRYRATRDTLLEILEHAAEDFLSTSPYLILGAFLAAAMQAFVGQSLLSRLGHGPILSVAVMMLLAFTLSLCSQADAFVAASFSQFPLASRIGFLVFGPTVDIKLIAMYQGFLSRRASLFIFGTVTVLVFLYCLLLHTLGV